MLNFKEGQIYICTKSDKPWFTPGKEYPVILDSCGKALIRDNDGDRWSSQILEAFKSKFKLKEARNINTLDLNKLTLEELDEYLELATSLEEAKYLMNDFIERMTK